MTKDLSADAVRQSVRQRYADVAESGSLSSCCSDTSCCGTSCCGTTNVDVASMKLGYAVSDVIGVPNGANMGLGCGNPQAIAALQPGEVVVDLGSGGGFDCFLAAQRVGEDGRVIGIDMTAEMISKARQNAEIGSYTNVEFRLGEIEALPVTDNVADVLISNCVINLSPEKQRVFHEAFRVLRRGGRLAISDVVATAEIPEAVRSDIAMLSGCISGASTVTDIAEMLRVAGFSQICITVNESSREFICEWAPGSGVEAFVASAIIEAVKEA